MAAAAAPIEMVTISAARLAELEALVDITAEMKKKLLKFNHSKVERVREYDREHPEKVRERVNRHREKHRDTYNAHRREQRRLKKEAAAATPGSG